MKITTKGRYALSMLLDLAEHPDDGYIPLKALAGRLDISKQYLEQIIPLLSSAGLVSATRGAQGGYRLARPAGHIHVGEILRITEGTLCPVPCCEDTANSCELAPDCKTQHVWQGLSRVIAEFLDNISLQDILAQNNERYKYEYYI